MFYMYGICACKGLSVLFFAPFDLRGKYPLFTHVCTLLSKIQTELHSSCFRRVKAIDCMSTLVRVFKNNPEGKLETCSKWENEHIVSFLTNKTCSVCSEASTDIHFESESVWEVLSQM